MTRKTFATMDEAAIAALTVAIPLARRDKWEYGGYIIKVPRGFSFTKPQTTQKTMYVDLSTQWEKLTGKAFPAGVKAMTEAVAKFRADSKAAGIVSTYHVHGCDWTLEDGKKMIAEGPDQNVEPRGFSFGDLVSDFRMGLAHGYVGVACDGSVLRSNYTTTNPIKAMLLGGAPGDLIGHIPV